MAPYIRPCPQYDNIVGSGDICVEAGLMHYHVASVTYNTMQHYNMTKDAMACYPLDHRNRAFEAGRKKAY